MLDFIVEILEENPLVTVSNLSKELRRRYPNTPEICVKILSNAIDGLAFTLKLSRDTPAQRNSSETKVDRKDNFIIPDGHGRGEATLSAFPFNQLKVLIDESSRAITTDKCVAWEIHSVTFYARCLQVEDIM